MVFAVVIHLMYFQLYLLLIIQHQQYLNSICLQQGSSLWYIDYIVFQFSAVSYCYRSLG